MAVFQAGRSRAGFFDDVEDLDDIDDWMARRNAEVAAQPDAEAAGRQGWEDATRSGRDVSAAQPSDVVALGARILGQGAANEEGSSDLSPATANDGSSIQSAKPIEPDGPLASKPNLRFATARPGDSISTLLGTSDPAAIGRFLSLNGMDPSRSTIYAGASYAIPASFDDASSEEVAAGDLTLKQDDERLAALRAQQTASQAADDLWRQRFNAGLNVWTGQPGAQPEPASPPAMEQVPTRKPWDDSMAAKRAAGEAAQFAGEGYGALRGGIHAVQGAIDSYDFLMRLGNPFDGYLSPAGASARDQVWKAGQAWADFVRARARQPGLFLKDASHWLRDENMKLNPAATPMSGTLRGEIQRKFDIGANRGDLAFNLGSLFAGGELAKGLEAASVAKAAPEAEAAARAALDPEAAEYMLEPYVGMGAHYIARDTRLPGFLGGGPLPSWFIDSPLNVSKLEGATRWQQSTYHYANDDRFGGGPIRGRRGRGSGYSGKRLGWPRNDRLTQSIAGMPALTRGILGGAAAAELNASHDTTAQDQPQ